MAPCQRCRCRCRCRGLSRRPSTLICTGSAGSWPRFRFWRGRLVFLRLADFVAANVDPLIPTTKKISKSHRLWKWLCGFSCFSLSWIFCCCHHCTCDLEMPHCPECNTCRCRSKCASCRIPKCQCFSCWNSRCFDNCTCRLPSCCCIPEFTSYLSWPSCFSYLSWPSCLTCSCSCVNPCSIPCSCPSIKFKCRYPKCPKVNVCSYCDKNCCYPCFFCF
ncbi:uncharacterized protein LOC142528306 isoform X2 [Primulina tabacum]|uniref:uncharacterized protein LOC142528306 isoform X2 n=1 Tax=Primulina tabacum TaxID=48773 RepID=UPI003F5AA4F8